MTPLRTLALLAPLLLAFALQGCIEMAAVGAGTAVLSAQDRRTTGAQIEDEGIELRAGNHISQTYGDKVHVNVTSYDRNVLLTGEVPDANTRAAIEKIAAAVPNVRGITNELQVAGNSSLTSRASDATITGKVKARFLDAGKFSPLSVKVVTEASVVYLLGIVTEQEAADAVEIARTTGGVRKVVKIFEYCKPTDPACRPPEKGKGDASKGKSG
ncbi:MAG TPA: BON domain-containing protein [Burkholderiales bacterium]|nr:BON domain-containing protein [Burkholderiales bacterium]